MVLGMFGKKGLGTIDERKLTLLRQVITENIRVQMGKGSTIEYVDVASALVDVAARQNHVIFGRRGCGKTLLLDTSLKRIQNESLVINIDCEDYKQHSFPNILIEVIVRVFECMERKAAGGWFSEKSALRGNINKTKETLLKLRQDADEKAISIKESSERSGQASAKAEVQGVGAIGANNSQKDIIERRYELYDNKVQKLNLLLPELKTLFRNFFNITKVPGIFLAIDDFYHLQRLMQPHVADYIHRLCKDVPIFFKIATLRHATKLYADRSNQPTGIQERHDYQPVSVDFTLADFKKTANQLKRILNAYSTLAKMTPQETENLFQGEGFERLVLAAGGVPRDFLSLLLDVLSQKQPFTPIGKDDIRQLSLGVLEHRIQELKQDSEQSDQDALLRSIYAIRKFCSEKKCNVFFVADRMLQENEKVQDLLNRLLDYRIIHMVGTALTNKSVAGTFQAYMIDIGAYANFRKLAERFNEIDVTASDAHEKIRNAPVLDMDTLKKLLESAPEETEKALSQDIE